MPIVVCPARCSGVHSWPIPRVETYEQASGVACTSQLSTRHRRCFRLCHRAHPRSTRLCARLALRGNVLGLGVVPLVVGRDRRRRCNDTDRGYQRVCYPGLKVLLHLFMARTYSEHL